MTYLSFISAFSVVIPLIAGLFYFKTLSSALKIIVFYLVLAFGVELLAYTMSLKKISNHTLYAWFMVVEYFMLALYFRRILDGKNIRKLIGITVIVFSLFSSFYLLFMASSHYASPVAVLESLLIISWILIYFTMLFRAEEMISLYYEPAFWVSVGLLVYFAGSFTANGMYNYFLRHTYYRLFEKAIGLYSNLLMYVLFTVGILCTQKSQKLT